MFGSEFEQIAAILVLAAVVGGLAKLLRQPVIVAYIVVGVLAGPAVLEIVSDGDDVAALAKIGIAILLFLVGLKLDVHLIRSTGLVALYTGVGQVVFTSLIGYLIILALGFDALPALYIAVALTFSSTIIIVKLLSDKRELDQLHGRIAVGFLIVQDLLVIVAMIVIVAIGQPDQTSPLETIVRTLVGGVVFLGAVALAARYVIPRVLGWLASSQELTLLFGVAWAISLAATSAALGLSMEIGAFVAGVALASTPYRESLGARLVSLRDIMILFFFIELGASLTFASALQQLGPALVLSVFVLIGNPIIVMVIMGIMGYRKKVSFKAGLAVAQISEFSLILIALGFSLGQVDEAVLGLVTLVGIITITISTYFILYSQQIFDKISPALSIFERKKADAAELKSAWSIRTTPSSSARVGWVAKWPEASSRKARTCLWSTTTLRPFVTLPVRTSPRCMEMSQSQSSRHPCRSTKPTRLSARFPAHPRMWCCCRRFDASTSPAESA